MVLLSTFSQVVKAENLAVVHLHHGPSEDFIQISYREQAHALVEKVSNFFNLRFFYFQSPEALKSEQSMRDFRHQKLLELRVQNEFDFIVLGHHQDDQVESQILHLVRGCGLQGLVGMQEVGGEVLRPFLGVAKRELLKYSEQREISYLEDPSNQNSDYLRNWVRNQWLPSLDQMQQGLKQSFMNSLLQISREVQSEEIDFSIRFDLQIGIPRQTFVGASKDSKKQMIYQYLVGLQVNEITQGQIEEILKRLDKGQNELIFRMSQTEWAANAQYIVARKKL